ncbi:MAG: diguanylate cyclase domain-containing protein [Methylophilus sp.]|uniref:diguanylate cyclase domain-containing protein n=1 Tax=Methylophilus sp. TaxID=29541 RepID=UPI003F9FD7B8
MKAFFSLRNLVAAAMLLTLTVYVVPQQVLSPIVSEALMEMQLLAELFVIVISALIAITAWNSLPAELGFARAGAERNVNHILLTGFSLVFIMHAAYLYGFVDEHTFDPTHKTTVFLFYARVFEIMVFAALTFGIKLRASRKTLLMAGLSFAAVLVLITEPYTPAAHVQSANSIFAYAVAGYMVALLYFGLAYLLFSQPTATLLQHERACQLAYTCVFSGLSLLCLQSHETASDLGELASHVFTLVAYTLLSKLTFVFTFEQYSQNLKQIQQQNQTELNTLIQALPLSIARLDHSLRYRYVNTTHEKVMGFHLDDTIGKHVDEILPHEIRETARMHLAKALEGKHGNFNYSIEKVDSKMAYRHVQVVPEPDEHNDGGVLMIILDTSDQEIMQQKVRQFVRELTELNAALDAHAIVAFTDRNGIITKVNDKFCEISKFSRAELIGRTHKIINSGVHPTAFFKDLWQTISSGQVWNGEICNRAKDGSLYWVHTTIVPFLGPDNKPLQYVAIRADITERKLAEERANYLALHDVLTGLANRRLMHERLEITMANCQRMSVHGALIMLDLDKFKHINDTYGHASGDELLKQVAKRLQRSVRGNDTAARLGGDEFVLIISDTGTDFQTAKETTLQFCARMKTLLNQHYEIDEHVFKVTASMGFVLFNGNQVSVDHLFERGDAALYEAKNLGKDRYVFSEV